MLYKQLHHILPWNFFHTQLKNFTKMPVSATVNSRSF